ncbi:hypothetical protein ACQPXM_41420 (plasmid) [Kribbella sp. CA-253562]|uniref:hypothetical protein n=1 Tax=Kribbella sp. CA-253562 TaxID=3239942 RepID=UPI003D92353E
MGTELYLDDVVDRINEQGVSAYVAETGDGEATIYAGAWHLVDDESRSRTAYSAVAGPGRFGWDQYPSTADTDDFRIGTDTPGDRRGTSCEELEITSSRDVANLIVAQVRLPLGRSLSQRQARRILKGQRPSRIPTWLQRRRTRCHTSCDCRNWTR